MAVITATLPHVKEGACQKLVLQMLSAGKHRFHANGWQKKAIGCEAKRVLAFARESAVVWMLVYMAVTPCEQATNPTGISASPTLRRSATIREFTGGLCSPPSQVALQDSQLLQADSTQSTGGPCTPAMRIAKIETCLS